MNIYKKEPPEWNDILKYYRGSELQNYFKNMVENKSKVKTII